MRNLKNINKVLVVDEGFKLQPYKDSKGFWTIGVGHYIGTNLESLRLTEASVNALLEDDARKHYQILRDIFGDQFLESIEEARVAALLSLAFTMGEGFKNWKNTIELIKNQEWERVAEIVLGSKWALDVDPKKREQQGRDDRVAFMLREGTYDAYYKIT